MRNYSHLIYTKTKMSEVNDISKVTQIVDDGAQIFPSINLVSKAILFDTGWLSKF